MEEKNTVAKSTDEYISKCPQEIQETLRKLRELIRDAAPGAVEKISYQMPAFELDGPLVYFAALKNHIGFYPTPSGIEAFIDELSEYKSSKGAVQFPIGKPLPYDLIRRIVEYRVAENKQKAENKKSKKK